MSKSVHEVIANLAQAMVAGELQVRGETAGLSARDAETVRQLNVMIDAMVNPMLMASNALEQVAQGSLPTFVIDEYQGEYDKIKRSINSLLAILYGIHGETSDLITNIGEGKLKTRGNDWDYDGIWKEMIGGINSTLDAVIAPIHEAGEVLDRLANYDLKARMRGKYHGEHAAIRKAMNTTAVSLHGAISQVSEAVGLVSEVGRKITDASTSVAQGAEEQNQQLTQTSQSLSALSDSTAQSSEKTKDACASAKQAVASILGVQESMHHMVSSMTEISSAAQSTASIADDIDGIAKETSVLAGTAVEKAARMRISAGGFGVVAQEIRKLSRQCSDTAKAMKEFAGKVDEEHRQELEELIAELHNVARFSNLLGVNAAIEAAHVEGTGNEFKAMTDEIQHLATRSADSARSTGDLTRRSSSLSQKGLDLSQGIDRQLQDAVKGAEAIGLFADHILQSIQEQTTGLEQISVAAGQITGVTEKNAASAAASLNAAHDLENQVAKLSKMVNSFHF